MSTVINAQTGTETDLTPAQEEIRDDIREQIVSLLEGGVMRRTLDALQGTGLSETEADDVLDGVLQELMEDGW